MRMEAIGRCCRTYSRNFTRACGSGSAKASKSERKRDGMCHIPVAPSLTPASADPRVGTDGRQIGDDERGQLVLLDSRRMSRSHHLDSPTPEQLAELLAACGLTAYAAGKLRLGVTARQLQRALKAEHPLGGAVWQYMRVVLTQQARDELPEPRA